MSLVTRKNESCNIYVNTSCHTYIHTPKYTTQPIYISQFPLKMLLPQNPPDRRETQISRNLTIQIQIEILIYTNRFEFPDLVNSGGAAIPVESVTHITKHKASTCHLQRGVLTSKTAEHTQMNESLQINKSCHISAALRAHQQDAEQRSIYTQTHTQPKTIYTLVMRAIYRVANTHRMHYLCTTVPAKEP